MMTKVMHTVGSLLILGLITTFVVLQFYGLTSERSHKKALEIERIEQREL